MKNALFFGDSLTAGYGLRNVERESFPALIQQKILAEKLDYEVINAGLSGDTSAGGLKRLDYWLNRPIDVFVLELGINDVIRGVLPQTTSKNLQAIINRVTAKYPNAGIALMGMEIPAFIRAPATQFRHIYRSIAEANKTVFVPFFLEGVAGQAHFNLRDGLHPSAEGYQVIANNVWPVIRPLFIDNDR